MKKTIIITVIILVILVVAFLVFDWGRRGTTTEINATTAEESPVSVDFPKENQTVKSPINISGKAKGNWFFEGSFPIQLIDADGNILGTSIATSTEDWMTTDFISFTSELTFEKSTSTTRAVLILKKDNPSGNPDSDQSIFIPVFLK